MLSLSVEEGRFTFDFRAGIWTKFQGITKGKWSRYQSLGFSKVDGKQICFILKKNSDLHLRKMQICFYSKKKSDLHLMKIQIYFYFKKKSCSHTDY